MREQSTQGQEPAAQNIVHLWREYLRPYKLTLAGAVLGGVIAALSSGFGIPAILQSVFSVIFDGEPLPVYAERLMLLFVRPEELPWLTSGRRRPCCPLSWWSAACLLSSMSICCPK